MKRVRPVSLAAAILVTAIQWAAFFSPALYTQSLPAVGGYRTSPVVTPDAIVTQASWW